ncbi:MAG: hypothetical protein QXS37_06435 [Candidatus Aenigmatarchaeota archaeon]
MLDCSIKRHKEPFSLTFIIHQKVFKFFLQIYLSMRSHKKLIFLLVFVSLSFANGATTQLQSALCTVYKTVDSILPVFAFALFAMAGAAYAAGQFFGAEMRARAQAWSMSMLTGAIIGILIVIVSKEIIKALLPNAPDITTLCPR